MLLEFKSAAEIADSLMEPNSVDTVVHYLAAGNKILLAQLRDVVEVRHIADASVLSESDRMEFAGQLFSATCAIRDFV